MNTLKSALRLVYKFISQKCPLICMFLMFTVRVMWSEYRLYSKVKRKYGTDCFILGGVFYGTGDYYCVGLFLEQWLEQNKIKNFVYIAKQGAEEKVLKLFPVFEGKVYSLSNRMILPSCLMVALCGENKVDMRFFHAPTLPNNICRGKKNVLQGYRGLDMLDYYLNTGFCLPRNTKPRLPKFSNDTKTLQNIFEKYGVKPGKTILLSPHTTGNKTYCPGDIFWEQLAESLCQIGFIVLTNCAGNEQPIKGTKEAFIPYGLIVPFLETAGGFIGIRSGLCEIISSAGCKKFIIHTHHSEWWHDGFSVSYTGLVHMGLCDDAVELTFNSDKQSEQEIIGEILEVFS